MIKGYAELLRLPGASAAAVPAALARLAGTMVPLALLLAVVESDHTLAAAGAVGAAYALGSATGAPAIGRLMDQLSPARVLPVTGPLAAALLVATGLWAQHLPVVALSGTAFSAGLTTAPIGASMRALWTRLTDDPRLRQRAYSFESTFSELLFIVGPSTVTLLASVLGARSALLLTATLLAVGALGYSRSSVVRQQEPQARRSRGPSAASRSRRSSAALSVLAAIALTAALSSSLAVAVTALLRAQGSSAALAGTLVALQSVGSVLGGLAYGARSRHGSTLARYLRLLAVLTIALGTLPAAYLAHRAGLPSWDVVALLGTLLVVSGIPMAPAGSEEFQLIGEMTAHQQMTQAFAGVGSFISIGGAAGSALGGLVADHLGPAAALCLPAALTAAALLVTLIAREAIGTATGRVPEPTDSFAPAS